MRSRKTRYEDRIRTQYTTPRPSLEERMQTVLIENRRDTTSQMALWDKMDEVLQDHRRLSIEKDS